VSKARATDVVVNAIFGARAKEKEEMDAAAGGDGEEEASFLLVDNKWAQRGLRGYTENTLLSRERRYFSTNIKARTPNLSRESESVGEM
jgi:hypothetical protein